MFLYASIKTRLIIGGKWDFAPSAYSKKSRKTLSRLLKTQCDAAPAVGTAMRAIMLFGFLILSSSLQTLLRFGNAKLHTRGWMSQGVVVKSCNKTVKSSKSFCFLFVQDDLT